MSLHNDMAPNLPKSNSVRGHLSAGGHGNHSINRGGPGSLHGSQTADPYKVKSYRFKGKNAEG